MTKSIPSIPKTILLLISAASILCIVGCSKHTTSNAASAPPQFALGTGDIISSVEVVTNRAGRVGVRFRLSDAKTRDLIRFLQEHSHASQMEVLVGTEALTKPGIQGLISISNGEIEASYPASESDYAQTVAASLGKR